MNRTVIRLTSVTYPVRAQKLLERQGIRSYLKKVSSSMSVHGCGYGLEIAGGADAAVQIITSAGIRVVAVEQL